MRLVFVRESDTDQGDATTNLFSDGQPMTEEQFLAIGETPERIELFDGSLHVTPAPSPLHQRIARRLANALDPGAEAVGLQVFETVNVRLRPDRVPIPDIVVTTDIDPVEPIIDAADVRLVCEIVSPSNAATDKVLKMHYYAAAGIPWYLLVDPQNDSLHLYELLGSTYAERSVTHAGEVLRLSEPIRASIDLAVLTPR